MDPAAEVVRFFNVRHANKYVIYNLAPEDSSLPGEKFGERIFSQYGFLHHQPPPLVIQYPWTIEPGKQPLVLRF